MKLAAVMTKSETGDKTRPRYNYIIKNVPIEQIMFDLRDVLF